MQHKLTLFLSFGLTGSVACGPQAASTDSSSDSSESGSSEPAPDFGDLGDGDGDGDGDDAPDRDPPDCWPESFVHAPSPVVIDGLPAVPIDILGLEAELSFDAPNTSAHAQGVMTFRLGWGGMPLFDLRQTPETLLLDGDPISPSALARHDFGRGYDYGFAILEVELDPCTEHQLEFSYPLGVPDAPLADGLHFAVAPARAYFDFYSSDLNPGRYLEAWFPANMPWDRHPISLAVSLTAEVEHTLITNATVDELAPHTWQLEYPATSTAMDPMLVLLPSDDVTSETGEYQAPNGVSFPYAVYVHTTANTTLEYATTSLFERLDLYVPHFGAYPHPAITLYVYDTDRSMEYAGGTTTSIGQLGHEVFHSWWARGLSPATYADGWIDEAWATSVSSVLFSEPFDWSASPVQLYDPHPFARDTPDASYTTGRLLFSGIRDLIGLDALTNAMLDIYLQAAPPASITTAQFEQQLYCTTGELPEIRQAFHQFVHGLDGDADPAPDGYCD